VSQTVHPFRFESSKTPISLLEYPPNLLKTLDNPLGNVIIPPEIPFALISIDPEDRSMARRK